MRNQHVILGHIERGTRIMSLETFVSICEALDAGADELLWGVVNDTSDVVRNMWEPIDAGNRQAEGKKSDSYSMYVRIMKSVAEIMNGV
ncbi:hypothetical protein C823_000761 [Eubacterium plexicaudatum ASF492]|nr:hypothetical protein C823_000761 [Eubacterium plexicaudatum ASF492]